VNWPVCVPESAKVPSLGGCGAFPRLTAQRSGDGVNVRRERLQEGRCPSDATYDRRSTRAETSLLKEPLHSREARTGASAARAGVDQGGWQGQS
jgi:hypothetical protein